MCVDIIVASMVIDCVYELSYLVLWCCSLSVVIKVVKKSRLNLA